MITQPAQPSPYPAAQKTYRRKTLFDWLLPPSLILFIITIFVPHGSLHSTLRTVLSWLILLLFLVMPLSPLWSILKTIGFALTGRLHFPTQRNGEIVTDAQGRQFTVFRQVVVSPAKDRPVRPGALLTLHFQVTNMSPAVNRFYALLPLPLYIGDPGFRSKLFTINGEDCQSIYEWDTVQDAEAYIQSIALKSILLRSVPGSFSYTILPMPS